jgi:putative membrane protein
MNRHHHVERRTGTLPALTLISAIVLAASCMDGATTKAVPESNAAPVSDRVAVTSGDGQVRSDAQIVHVLVTANTGEVELGMLAEAKASASSVKDFATMMITDHNIASAKVQSLAQQKGIVPEDNAVSQELKAEGERTASRLESLSGAEFDRAYMDAQIAGHEKVLAIVDDALTVVHDPDLGELLTSFRETVASHLEHAEHVRGELASSTTAAGAAAMP